MSNKIPNIVTVAVFTLITVIFWISYSVIVIIIKGPEVSVSEQAIAPLDPSLDVATLGTLQNKNSLSDEEVNRLISEISIAATPNPDALEEEEEIEAPTPTPEVEEPAEGGSDL